MENNLLNLKEKLDFLKIYNTEPDYESFVWKDIKFNISDLFTIAFAYDKYNFKEENILIEPENLWKLNLTEPKNFSEFIRNSFIILINELVPYSYIEQFLYNIWSKNTTEMYSFFNYCDGPEQWLMLLTNLKINILKIITNFDQEIYKDTDHFWLNINQEKSFKILNKYEANIEIWIETIEEIDSLINEYYKKEDIKYSELTKKYPKILLDFENIKKLK